MDKQHADIYIYTRQGVKRLGKAIKDTPEDADE